LFFNDKEEILIVKPNYREDWLLPGGATEAEESPIECGVRETKEEIGVTILENELNKQDILPYQTVIFSSVEPRRA
jgi:8-oxo-dGTP pyrophosphatase MutT (NUDIX family)